MDNHSKDLAIQRLAELQGFTPFRKENNGISVIDYGAQNMRTKMPKSCSSVNNIVH